MMKLGTCGKVERLTVVWYEGDRIVVEGANITIVVDGWDKAKAIETCKRNLADFEMV